MHKTLTLQMQGLGQSDLPFTLLLATEDRQGLAETLRAVKDMVLLYDNIPLSSLVQCPHQGACIWSKAYRTP